MEFSLFFFFPNLSLPFFIFFSLFLLPPPPSFIELDFPPNYILYLAGLLGNLQYKGEMFDRFPFSSFLVFGFFFFSIILRDSSLLSLFCMAAGAGMVAGLH